MSSHLFMKYTWHQHLKPIWYKLTFDFNRWYRNDYICEKVNRVHHDRLKLEEYGGKWYIILTGLNISTKINIKILTNSNQQTQSYKFISHIAAFLSVVLITEMLEICIQTSYDQNVQLILKSYLPVVYGTPLSWH